MPGTASASSPNRLGPSSNASTICRVQRSPTASRARASGESSAIAAIVIPWSGSTCTPPMLVVTCELQVTSVQEAAMAVIDEIAGAVRQVSKDVGASVVGVAGRWGIGSGIVLEPGKVLTNAHNLRGETITVTFSDGRTAEARVAGSDIDGDIAV